MRPLVLAAFVSASVSVTLACVVLSACLNVTPYPTIDAGSPSDAGLDGADRAGDVEAGDRGDANTTSHDGGAG